MIGKVTHARLSRHACKVERKIAVLHKQIMAAARMSLKNAIEIGRLLTQRKAQLRHGQWLPWAEKLPFSPETTRRYMRVYERRDELKSVNVTDLSDAYALITGKTKAELIVASGENEWFTPAIYVEAARTVLGEISLDPASTEEANKVVQAAQFYDKSADAFMQEWHGTVWLNPPYGGWAGQFISRLVDDYRAGRVTAAVALVNANCTDTDWFQPLWDYLLCFTDHRIDFTAPADRENASGSTHGSVFVYLGSREDLFIRVFGQFGAVVRRVSTLAACKTLKRNFDTDPLAIAAPQLEAQQ
jgi:ParB family chromosome partitioning protein